jgi:hypothetical protein
MVVAVSTCSTSDVYVGSCCPLTLDVSSDIVMARAVVKGTRSNKIIATNFFIVEDKISQ